MRKSFLAAIVIIILIAIGIGVALSHNSNPPSQSNQSSTGSSSQSQNPSTGEITIVNMLFTPSQITVAKGGTVTWTNKDNTVHTVIDDLSNVDGPNSGAIAPGQTYNFTFNKAGSFQYHDRLHTSMRGTIVVK